MAESGRRPENTDSDSGAGYGDVSRPVVGMNGRPEGSRGLPAELRAVFRQHTALAVVTFAYIAGLATAALFMGNTEFVIYAVFLVAIIGLILAMHLRIRFSTGLLWALSVWGFVHLVGGTIPCPYWVSASGVGEGGSAGGWQWGVVYDFWLIPGRLRYDQVVHAFGFGSATWLCWEGLRHLILDRETARGRPRDRLRVSSGLAVLIMLMGMGLGAMNEVVEFTLTIILPDTNVGGYENTGWDLVSNLVGSSAATLGIWRTAR